MAKYKIYENPQNGYQEMVKDGFSWGAFLLGPIWYLMNNMIGRGIAWVCIAMLAGTLTFGIGGFIVWGVVGFKANQELEKSYAQRGWKMVGYRGEDGE